MRSLWSHWCRVERWPGGYGTCSWSTRAWVEIPRTHMTHTSMATQALVCQCCGDRAREIARDSWPLAMFSFSERPCLGGMRQRVIQHLKSSACACASAYTRAYTSYTCTHLDIWAHACVSAYTRAYTPYTCTHLDTLHTCIYTLHYTCAHGGRSTFRNYTLY